MFLEIVMKALREKNPEGYQQMQRDGTLSQFVRDLDRSAKRAYDLLTRNADANQKAMVREVVIAQIVEEIEKPKPAQEVSLM